MRPTQQLISLCSALVLMSACQRSPRAGAEDKNAAPPATAAPRTGCTDPAAAGECPPDNATRSGQGRTGETTAEELEQPGNVGGTGGSQHGTVGDHGGPQRGTPPRD